MKTMDTLMAEADELLERGEERILTDTKAGISIVSAGDQQFIQVISDYQRPGTTGRLKSIIFPMSKV